MKYIKIVAFFLALAVYQTSWAAQSQFRQQFIQARETNRFEALVNLVKLNKAIIPAEVRAMLKEVQSNDKTYYEKIMLIDTANALASMHKFWNEDEAPLAEVEALQKKLIAAENERLAEIEKLARYERYPGNVLMNSKGANLYSKGLDPVVFSHWSHRLYYECRACHNGLFKPERGANEISHVAIGQKRACGACHNGAIAFNALRSLDTNENCERCHSASKKPAKRPVEPSTDVDLTSVKKTAESIGAKWNPEGLVNRSLPLDRFGFIDWMALKKNGAYAPLKSIDKTEPKDGTRDNTILFTPQMPGINKVAFSHSRHTEEINCNTCHQSVFKDALGANRFTMTDMASGQGCGYCHSRTAFKFADCTRCHSVPPDKKPHDPNVLVR